MRFRLIGIGVGVIMMIGVYWVFRPQKKSEQLNECISPIEQKLDRSIVDLAGRKPARMAVFHIVTSKSKEDFLKMNKMAILAITVFSQKEVHLPLHKIIFETQEGKTQILLPSIYPKVNLYPVPSTSRYGKVLGAFRQDIFAFIPVRLLKTAGSLKIVYRDKVSELRLAQFPVSTPESFTQDLQALYEDPRMLPDPEVVTNLLRTTFCF
ncbi:MAG: hypothetical protein CL678_13500 [Bdellovibrionaceae bacterium]|nr:hypothetical protein [Pseudobdellovibrionaceae bacterium]